LLYLRRYLILDQLIQVEDQDCCLTAGLRCHTAGKTKPPARAAAVGNGRAIAKNRCHTAVDVPIVLCVFGMAT
jgi:hypothetical protein